jgi:wyosine [tRNA(Phe)-imidazoG37] synthetase (radical SAM superfamily)
VGYVFGPVPSRRLGYSLGVDVVPEKHCTQNCVYCQIGKTKDVTLARRSFFPVADVLREIEAALSKGKAVDYVTFSGSGEPTLNKDLGKLIRGVKKRTDVKVCLLTNGTLFTDKQVRAEAALADVVVPSLDAGSEEVFRRVCRPHPDVTLEKLVGGLVAFRAEFRGQLWLEVMLVAGVNDGTEELLRIKRLAARIRPDKIQLNTVVRPPQDEGARALSPVDLERIRELFGETAETIPGFTRREQRIGEAELPEAIFELVRRRSVTVADVVSAMGVTREEALAACDRLVADGRIKKVVHGAKAFYRESY